MWTLQTERSVITVGIVFCGAGVLCVCSGVWAWRNALRFQANAVETVATVVPADSPRGGLRFETDQGVVEIPIRRRGFHQPIGANLRILYEPGNLQGWTQGPMQKPSHELGLAGVGVGMFLLGVVLLVLGWISRRRNRRPFWL